MFRTILSLAAAASALAVMTDHRIAQATSSSASAMVQATAPPPEGTLSNGQISLRVYLPDPDRGFYRSTRFDWSGVIASLTYRGHEYYGPWFTGTDPAIRDFVFKGEAIIASPQSAVTGPAEEFPQPQGFDEAKPGGTFVKVGVGVLRKQDAGRYSPFQPYELVDGGRWTVQQQPDSLTFTQELSDDVLGYGYEYRKTLRVAQDRPELVIEHSLRNTGRRPLATTQYNHNFLTIDREPIGPDLVTVLPFQASAPKPPDPAVLALRGNEVHFARPLQGEQRAHTQLLGFGATSRDFDLRVENRRTGAGFRMTGDRPLAQLALWSIRSVMSLEPFVDVTTAPGETTRWNYTYTYFAP